MSVPSSGRVYGSCPSTDAGGCPVGARTAIGQGQPIVEGTDSVRGRHHRDWAFGDIDVEFQAALVDRWEVGLDDSFGLLADGEVDALDISALNLVVACAGDAVSRGQLAQWLAALHE